MAFVELKSVELGMDEVQIWPMRLCASPETVREMEELLSPDELARADRFVTEELRIRHVLCRGALRQILGSVTDKPPASLQFHYETWGKPQLVTKSHRALPVHFNVSHSADIALIACARSTVGIDIEKFKDRTSYRDISSHVISDRERAAWVSIPSSLQDRAILELWVCKESLLKALGVGIADALKRIAFTFPITAGERFSPVYIDAELMLQLDEQESCHRNSWIDPQTWRVQPLVGFPDCYAAVTTLRQIKNIVVHDCPNLDNPG